MDGRHCPELRKENKGKWTGFHPGWGFLAKPGGRCEGFATVAKQWCAEGIDAERYEWQPPQEGPRGGGPEEDTCELRRDDAVRVFADKTTCFWGDSLTEGQAITLQQEMYDRHKPV